MPINAVFVAIIISLSRALLRYVEQYKSYCVHLSNDTDNLPSSWEVATDIICLGNLTLLVRTILFQCSLCFQLLYSVALWHGVQAALYRAIKAWRVAAGNRRSCDQGRKWAANETNTSESL